MDIIKVKKDYANAVYQKYIEDLYGIKICCDKDFDLAEIKNSIVDLDSIYDKDKCRTINLVDDCCLPPCDVNAILYVPQILQCQAPEITSIQFLIG